MRRQAYLLLAILLLALAACLGPVPETLTPRDRPAPLTPAAGGVLDEHRRVAAAFTIHFDEHGGWIEMVKADGGQVPAEMLQELPGEARVLAGEGDVGIDTIAWSFSPPGGTCGATQDWGCTVEVTNSSAATWWGVLAQLDIHGLQRG